MTDWGDHGHHQYLPLSYAGFSLGACQSWNHKASQSIDLPDLVNRLYFQETEPLTAGLLERMGRVLELAPSKIRNATIFNRLLFWDMKREPQTTQSIPDDSLRACATELTNIRSTLQLTSQSNNLDDGLVVRELQNAIDMAIHGIQRLQYFRGGHVTLPDLRKSLSRIIGCHEELWLARNRPGGLAESTNHLRQSLNSLN